MFKPTEELKKIREKQNKVVADVARQLFNALIQATPVGNPSLWKNPKSAPAGYSGGDLRKAWTLNKEGDTWVLNNPLDYAEIRLSPYADNGQIGSKQMPAGIAPIIQKYQKILEKRLRSIK